MEEEFYSEVQEASQPHRRQYLEIPQRKGPSNISHRGLPAPSSSWKIIAMTLGIICLGLIMSLGYFVTQWTPKLVQVEEYPGNISYRTEAKQTDCKSLSCSMGWHQYGENCYHFARTLHVWKDCQSFCNNLNSNFLKVNTDEEMNFIFKFSKMQCDMQNEMFSISLYYNSRQLKWLWLDGTDLTLSKSLIPGYENANDKCVHIKYGKTVLENCQTEGYCICKKTTYH